MRINRKELNQASNAVSRFTNPRSPKPAMQCLQLEVDGEKMRIRGYGTYGSASMSISCAGKLNVVVNAASFCKTVDLLPDDEVELKALTNKLRLKGSTSSIEVPIYAIALEPSIGKSGAKLCANAKDVAKCIEIASTVGSSVEMSYANGVRISTTEGKLHFSSMTSKSSAFSWCDYSGSDIDVVVARGGTAALLKMLSTMSEVTIEDRDSHVGFYCGSSAAIMLKEVAGKLPLRYTTAKQHWARANRWNVSRGGVNEFVRYAMAVSTPEATGVWLRPTPSGLFCQYTGVSDGTHSVDLSVEATCETHVPGDACEGSDVYISCKMLAPAIAAIGDEEFVIKALDNQAIFLETQQAVIGLSQMAHPNKAEVCN